MIFFLCKKVTRREGGAYLFCPMDRRFSGGGGVGRAYYRRYRDILQRYSLALASYSGYLISTLKFRDFGKAVFRRVLF